MKDLGIKTFWMPLKPGADDNGKQIDYSGPAMDPVWDAIEESGLPIAHHIGEAPLGRTVPGQRCPGRDGAQRRAVP